MPSKLIERCPCAAVDWCPRETPMNAFLEENTVQTDRVVLLFQMRGDLLVIIWRTCCPLPVDTATTFSALSSSSFAKSDRG
jgi:hypothetical protein